MTFNEEQQYWLKKDFILELLRRLPLQVFWKNKESVFLGCNDAFAKFVGLRSPEEIIGKTDYDLPATKEESDAFRLDDKHVMESRQPKLNIEESQTFPDGRTIVLLTNKVPLFGKDGEVIGVLGIYSDITERKNMELDLREAKDQAEMADRAKTEFIANMSHDIKTPLTGVIGIAQILEKKIYSEEVRNYASMIQASGEQLLVLLNNVLDVISVDHVNEDDIYRETFDLRLRIGKLQELMLPACELKNIGLHIDIDPDVPNYVVSDSIKIERILLNLLSNAIKFTKKGEIALQIKLLEKRKEQAQLEFSVSDTGIGIAKAQINRVFDRFFRVHPAHEGVYQGKGIGLYIVKKFIELLGGSVQVASKINKGTTFRFNLTMQIGRPGDVNSTTHSVLPLESLSNFVSKKSIPIPPIAYKDNSTSSDYYQVLLVEDDPIAATSEKNLLQEYKCEVYIASDAESALELMKTNRFDFIVSDIGLPGMDGMEFATVVRFREKISKRRLVPIFGITAHAERSHKDNCLSSGMSMVFSKPLSDANIQSIFQLFVPNTNKSGESTQTNQNNTQNVSLDLQQSQTPEELFQFDRYPLLDLEASKKVTNNNAEVLKTMLEMLIEVVIPEELVNIQKAYSEKNWVLIRKLAHKLKGSSTYCGATRMYHACQYMERYQLIESGKSTEISYQQFVTILEDTMRHIKSRLDKIAYS